MKKTAQKNSGLSAEEIRQKLKLKHFKTKKAFEEKYPEVEKFLLEKGVDVGKIRQHSAKIIGAGALTGALLLQPPGAVKSLPNSNNTVVQKYDLKGKTAEIQPPKEILLTSFQDLLPAVPRPLDRTEEKQLEQVVTNETGIPVRATLEGEHLNTIYGLIGAEQHLRRYPGDTISQHGEGTVLKEGIAPGLGAWGYFARSKSDLNQQDVQNEKWYAVVQTLYLPDWNTRQPYLRNWYKYRKVMIVNTKNGNAVVADIADSGPAAWTGKQFGGSPEVMDYLGGSRYKKGAVLIFFVDDPENKIPLGPVDYNKLNLPKVAYKGI